MSRTLGLLLPLAMLGACAPKAPISPDPDPVAVPVIQDTVRMASVLQGLRPRVEIAGRPIRWTIEERMAHHGVPGLSIAVIKNGEIAWVRGAGVKEAGRSDPVTPATLFQAASISKPVTATAMLRLVERGTLDLDADVNRYLTSWKVPENRFTAAEKVTLRRIASHNAGLTVSGFPGYTPGAPLPTVAQVLAGAPPANTKPVVVDTFPGAIGRYSGGGTTVMQQLLTDVTGESFPELMRRLVLEPAGMKRSTYEQPLPPSLAHEAARGHNGKGEVVPGGWHLYPEQAAAGLWTTPTDLAKWAIAIADAWAGRSSELLSHETARQMLTVQKDGFGLGPQVRGGKRELNFGHGGSNNGFRAVVRMFPETGAGVVIMTNGGDAGEPLMMEVLRAVAAEYGWPDYAPQNVIPIAVDSTVVQDLVGTYLLRVGPGRPVEVRLEGGRLMLHGPQDRVQELVPESETRFVSLITGWRIEFTRDASGRVVGIRVFPDPSGTPVEGTRTQ